MDARTSELGAAARGHAPPSDLLRQVLAGRGPAHTAPRVAQTQAAGSNACGPTRLMVSPWQSRRARLTRCGSDTRLRAVPEGSMGGWR